MEHTGYHPPIQLSLAEFKRFASLAKSQLGLYLPESKITLVEARLQKRIQSLGFRKFGQYADYLATQEGKKKELPVFISKVTTHKTEFLREPEGFLYLVQQAIPQLIQEGTRPIRLWSAACSSGEEPYSMAMYLAETFGTLDSSRFVLVASDVSEESVEQARRGIYLESQVQNLPIDWRKKYLLRSKKAGQNLVRIAPELRAPIQFMAVNLLHPELNIRGKMQVILLRNVMIYFDRPTRLAILNIICGRLSQNGYLVVGHAESLHGLPLPLKQVNPMVYRRI
ncbi:MAG: CheR family methyltransferase [bacterium]|nr:CheR family methyltransferase [bacterium]